jgi:hypothetical protein
MNKTIIFALEAKDIVAKARNAFAPCRNRRDFRHNERNVIHKLFDFLYCALGFLPFEDNTAVVQSIKLRTTFVILGFIIF